MASNLTQVPSVLASAITESVTNGNAHDHVGGDGAQINHTGLASKGTNTHSTIDSQLPSANEKAALAGTSGTAPSGTNKLVDAADTRLTNSRAPTAHGSLHTNGTDNVASATTTDAGLMSAADKVSLNYLAAPTGANRPSSPYTGQMFFDAVLSPAIPVWWNGATWVDATGTEKLRP